MEDLLKKLTDFASSDKDAKKIIGAGTDLIKHLLKGDEENNIEHLLSGDKHTDASIFRGKAVEKVIKDSWGVEIGDALDFVYLIIQTGVKLSGLFAKTGA